MQKLSNSFCPLLGSFYCSPALIFSHWPKRALRRLRLRFWKASVSKTEKEGERLYKAVLSTRFSDSECVQEKPAAPELGSEVSNGY